MQVIRIRLLFMLYTNFLLNSRFVTFYVAPTYYALRHFLQEVFKYFREPWYTFPNFISLAIHSDLSEIPKSRQFQNRLSKSLAAISLHHTSNIRTDYGNNRRNNNRRNNNRLWQIEWANMVEKDGRWIPTARLQTDRARARARYYGDVFHTSFQSFSRL